MALIDTVPTHTPVLPSDLAGQANGKLDGELLRNFDGKGALHWIASYAMQALHLAAADDGIDTRTTGRYRSFDRQVALVHERMSLTPRAGATTRTVPTHTYAGVDYPRAVWYLLPGMAQVATPGTSNHGWGCADDLAEENDDDAAVDGMSDRQLTWMRDNARAFGFALETRKERWHWCWIGGDDLSPRAIAVLRAAGIDIPTSLAPPIIDDLEEDLTVAQADEIMAAIAALDAKLTDKLDGIRASSDTTNSNLYGDGTSVPRERSVGGQLEHLRAIGDEATVIARGVADKLGVKRPPEAP